VALSCFLAKSAEHNLPFFKTLKGSEPLSWTLDCHAAFEALKAHLFHLKTLALPLPSEGLLLYLSVSASAVSSALVLGEKSNGHSTQRDVYYISEALAGAKTRYTELKKIAYALLMASRKLRHYFLAYDITVPTLYPLGDMFCNREATGRIGKWAVELAPFVVRFVARTTVKSQILADFIAEWTPAPTEPTTTPTQDIWTIYTNEAYCSMGARAGAVLISPIG
jgi:hypothetical protein